MYKIPLSTSVRGETISKNSTKTFEIISPDSRFTIENELILAITYSYGKIVAVRTFDKLYITNVGQSITTTNHINRAIKELSPSPRPEDVVRRPLEIFEE